MIEKKSGTYALILTLSAEKQIRVGKLGTFEFPPGFYIYVGTAFGPGGLRARVSRHIRHQKKSHWHIDFLSVHADITDVLTSTAPQKLECALAAAFAGDPDFETPVPGFGASDCACPAHLFFSPHPVKITEILAALPGEIQQTAIIKEDYSKLASRCLPQAASRVTIEGFKAGASGTMTTKIFYTSSGGENQRAILKIFPEDFEDYSKIGVWGTVRKIALAGTELSVFGISSPAVLGTCAFETGGAVLTRFLTPKEWTPQTRPDAARILAKLHSIDPNDLSPELQTLNSKSTRNRYRIRNGVEIFSKNLDDAAPDWRIRHPNLSTTADKLLSDDEPLSEKTTLIHGDYFSKNILATTEGTVIIDWDLLSLGDPMWDLGFLTGADRDLSNDDIAETIQIYNEKAPICSQVLDWHRRCWRTFWQLRDLMEGIKENEQIS